MQKPYKVCKTIYLDEHLIQYINSLPGKNFQRKIDDLLQKCFDNDGRLVEIQSDGSRNQFIENVKCIYRWDNNKHEGELTIKNNRFRKNRPPSKIMIDEILTELDSTGYKTQVVDTLDNDGLIEVWAVKTSNVELDEILMHAKRIVEVLS